VTPRTIRPAALRRRDLAVDVAAAVTVALLVLELTAGLGVVAFIALPLLLLGLLWIGAERVIRRVLGRRRTRVPEKSRPA
jgi:hypothetical protein